MVVTNQNSHFARGKTSTKDKLNEKMFDLPCCLQYNKTKWPVKEAKVVSTWAIS